MINYKALIYIKLDITRIGIETIFKKGFEDCLLMVAHSDEEFERLLQDFFFNLVIIQVNYNSIDELDLIKRIRDNYNGSKILIFNSNRYKSYYKNNFIKSANGIIDEETTSFEVIQIINVLLKSCDYFSNQLVVKNLQKDDTEENNLKVFKFKRLSTREFEVAMLLIKGHSNNDICNLLNLSASSVGTFKTRILIKTNSKNIIELFQLYQSELSLY